MSVFTARQIGVSAAPNLSDRPWLSSNLQTADEGFLYDPNHVVSNVPDAGDRLYRFPEIHTNVFVGIANSFPPVFYQGLHFTIGTTIYDRTRYSAGVVTSLTEVFVRAQSMVETRKTVASISVTSGQGLVLSGISNGDVFNPYEDKLLVIEVDNDGPTSFSGLVSITFVGDSVSYYFTIFGTRAFLPSMLPANWLEGMTVSRQYLTTVFNASNATQSRKALRKYPALTMEGTLTFPDKRASTNAWQFLRSRAMGQNVIPFYPDAGSMASANTTTKLFTPTAYRRYHEGGLVIAARRNSDFSIVHYDVLRVTTVESDGLVVESPPVNSYAIGDFISPALVCYPSFGSDTMQAVTRSRGFLGISASEVYGETCLGRENSSYTPTEILGYPVFNFRINEINGFEISSTAQGGLSSSGRGNVFFTEGDWPSMVQSIEMLCETREMFWEAIGFFNCIKGRGRSFWMRNYNDFIEPVEEGSGYIVVDQLSVDDWDMVEYLFLEGAAGAIDIVAVTDIVDDPSGIRIEFTVPSITPTGYYQAILVGMASDEVQEQWITDSIMTLSFAVEEKQGAYNA